MQNLAYKNFLEFLKKFKAPDRCAQLFDRERFSITDKHTEVLDCISYITQTDRRTDGRYQTYYLPCFAVDNHDPLAKLGW